MAEQKNTKALGRGLRALIKDQDSKEKLEKVEKDKRDKNIEFYKALVKQYVQTGEQDALIENYLNHTRGHLGISEDEHQGMLEALRKEEKSRKSPPVEDQEQYQAEVKEELKSLFKEFKKEAAQEELKEKQGSEKEMAEKHLKKLKKRVLKKPGIIEEGTKSTTMRKLTLEWEEDLENGKEPIPMKPINKGLDEAAEPIEAQPSTMGDEEEVPMGVMIDHGSKIDNGIEEMEDIPDEEEPIPETEKKARLPDAEELEEGEPEEPAPEEEEEAPSEGKFKKPELEEPEEVEEDIEEMEEETEEEEVEAREAPPKVEKEIKLEDSIISVRVLMEEGRFGQAFEMAQRLLENDPENSTILNECGVILYNLNDIEGALECYRNAFDIQTPTTEMLINYSLILSEKGELDLSLQTLDRSLEKDPYSEDAWNNKAVVLYKAGRNREALECLDHALRINDKSVETWANAGIILEKMGEYGPALECYKNILEIDPGNRTASEGVRYCRERIQ
ncbi:MAG: tetratricopeptide repeat protein [Thermoplasmatota archaeon]